MEDGGVVLTISTKNHDDWHLIHQLQCVQAAREYFTAQPESLVANHLTVWGSHDGKLGNPISASFNEELCTCASYTLSTHLLNINSHIFRHKLFVSTEQLYRVSVVLDWNQSLSVCTLLVLYPQLKKHTLDYNS